MSQTESNPDTAPELKLWRTALLKLINDAQDHLISTTRNKTDRATFKAAFNDLCACGRMTRRLCRFADYDAEWLSDKFRKYVRDYYGQE